MRRRIHVYGIPALILAAACASESSPVGPSTIVQTPATSTIDNSAVPSSEATTSTLLGSNSWTIDPVDLVPLDRCKIADITPGTPDGVPFVGSGFPIPRAEAADFVNGRVWIVRIETTDAFTDEDGLQTILGALDRISDFFSDQSFGRANLTFFVDYPGSVVTLPSTAVEFGIDRVSPQEDMSYVLREALNIWDSPEDFRAGDQIFGLLPLVPTRPSIAQGIRLQIDLNGRRSGDGLLMTPGAASNWNIISHEIGHSWLFLEDLYSFGVEGPYENYLETWDLMAAPGGPNLGFISWSRWRVGWLDDDQILCTTPVSKTQRFVHQLDSETSDLKAVVFPQSEHSALVAEVRQGFGANADKSIVVVYEVDTSFGHGNGPIRLRGTLREVGDSLIHAEVQLSLEAIDISGALISIAAA